MVTAVSRRLLFACSELNKSYNAVLSLFVAAKVQINSESATRNRKNIQYQSATGHEKLDYVE